MLYCRLKTGTAHILFLAFSLRAGFTYVGTIQANLVKSGSTSVTSPSYIIPRNTFSYIGFTYKANTGM